jgi:hypothetical protein
MRERQFLAETDTTTEARDTTQTSTTHSRSPNALDRTQAAAAPKPLPPERN